MTESESVTHHGTPPISHAGRKNEQGNHIQSHYAPVLDICTSCEGMAYRHAVVSPGIQLAPGLVGDLHILQHVAVLQLEVVDCSDPLGGYQAGVSIGRL